MATIAAVLNAISVEHGYTGAAPKTIAGAIDALADTLAGEDVTGSRSIAGAVKALAPYIGSGGGGTTLGGYAVPIMFSNYKAGDDQENLQTTVYASTAPITWNAEYESFDYQADKLVVNGVTGQGEVSVSLSVCGDLYVMLEGAATDDTTAEDFSVTYGDSAVEHETHLITGFAGFKGFYTFLRIPRATDDSWTPLVVTVGTDPNA